VIGLVICGLAGLAMVGMTAILALGALWPAWRLVSLISPTTIILAGFLLIAWGILSRRASPSTALVPSQGVTEVVETKA
jgi:hypothetical protein